MLAMDTGHLAINILDLSNIWVEMAKFMITKHAKWKHLISIKKIIYYNE
jgi:hypothetical protein